MKADSCARQIILDSAIGAFAQKGYAGTSLQDILKATRLSKPTLYYYFESKAGLFRAILDFAYDECFRLMSERVKHKSRCEEILVALATALFRFAEDNKDLTRLIFSTVFAAPQEIPRGSINKEKRRRNFELVYGFIRQAQKRKEIDLRYSTLELAHGIYGAISHQIRTQLLIPRGHLNCAKAKRIVELFLNGARKKI
ncbi:MAG: TetR/AcrR family transcriptional regulator [Verrucomicrobiae bacterium]|nr:TetR/AcrR family transcriptional regulator [Verrucomicrobiae bacterium]